MSGAPRCALCGERGDQTKELTSIGGVLQSIGPMLGPFQHNTYCHRLCALWSPEVYHENDKIRNVLAAVKRGRGLRCSYCGLRGATVGCCVDWCGKSYHIRCAEKAGCEINALEWILSCPEHSRRKSKKGGVLDGGPYAPSATAAVLANNRGASRKRVAGAAGVGPSGQAAGGKRSKRVSFQNLFGGPVDVDEELWKKKQERRVERDIKALQPQTLGGAAAGDGGEKTNEGAAAEAEAEAEATPFDGGWESVGGHEEVKRALKEAVLLPLMYQSEFSALNLTCPRGVLLHGEPGTGKTMVVRALANECNRCLPSRKISFFSRKGADLLGKFHGEAERKLRLLFQEAQKASPSIIFFDELDGIAPARGGRVSDQIHTSVVSTLLSLMDGLVDRGKVVVIAATNRADAIDPALRRPGRFDREIHFPLPDLPQRVKILSACTRKWSARPQESQLERMAVLTEGFAGADLQSLCTNAALARLRREFPSILDGVEDNRRIKDFAPRLEAMAVEDRDFVFALQNITKACSHRTVSGMLSLSKLEPVPCYLLEAVWRPLYQAVCVVTGSESAEGSPVQGRAPAAECPGEARALLSRVGAVSDRVLVSATESKIMAMGDQPSEQSSEGYMPHTNILVCGEASAYTMVAESLLGVLPGFRIVKVSLPQVVREGYENVANGIISLTAKAFTYAYSDKIVIYCPDIHDWLSVAATEEGEGRDGRVEEEDGDCGEPAESHLAIWNAFLQALRTRGPGCKLFVLATCGLPKDEIPSEMAAYFDGSSSGSRNKKIIEIDAIGSRTEVMAKASAEYLMSASHFLVGKAAEARKESLQKKQEALKGSDSTGGVAEGEPEEHATVELDVGTNGYVSVKIRSLSDSSLAGPEGAGRRSAREEDAEKMLALESATTKFLGDALLHDSRCGLLSQSFLSFAKDAHKYKRLKDFKAEGKRALRETLQKQSRSPLKHSAAFAIMDKIDSFCFKAERFMRQKFPACFEPIFEERQPSRQKKKGIKCKEEAKANEVGGDDAAKEERVMVSLQPQVFEHRRDVGVAAPPPPGKVLAVLRELLGRQKKVGHVGECITRILSGIFAQINEGSEENQEVEGLVLSSVHRCFGLPA